MKDECPAIIDEIAGGVSDWYEYRETDEARAAKAGAGKVELTGGL